MGRSGGCCVALSPLGAVAVKCHGLRELRGCPMAEMFVKPCFGSQVSSALSPQCFGGPLAVKRVVVLAVGCRSFAADAKVCVA